MKKLVISALAASLTSAAAIASESEWADLDRDVQALSASLSGLESSGISVDGRIRILYTMSGDRAGFGDANGNGIADPGETTNDLGAFSLPEARIKLSGSRGDVGYVVQIDVTRAPSVLDGYIDIPVGENLSVRAGAFKAIISRNALISSGKLFFADRSEIGSLFSGRDAGAALRGSFDTFHWAITVQNGSDMAGDEYLLALHGELDFLGDGAGMVEGAYGAGDDLAGTVGVSYWDDGQIDDGTGILFEGAVASSMYSANIWVAQIDGMSDGAGQAALPTSNGSTGFLVDDSTPFGIMGTFMVAPPTETQGGWEIGARFQDMDDVADTNILDLGVNYYGSGHDYKYFLHWQSIDSDNLAAEGDIIYLGVAVGF